MFIIVFILFQIYPQSKIIFEVEDYFADLKREKDIEVSSQFNIPETDKSKYLIGNQHGIYFREQIVASLLSPYPFLIPGIRITDLPKNPSGLEYPGFTYI
ncbi:MAG TPA: hypothetical protein ENN73_02685, partial [Firmicutes bacterium]|nr:hypothetical protein [Bacillota bacterium]